MCPSALHCIVLAVRTLVGRALSMSAKQTVCRQDDDKDEDQENRDAQGIDGSTESIV